MICPQTKAECDSAYGCRSMGCRVAPKPTMAEIERLVDALRQSSFDLGELVWKNATIKLVRKARKIDEQNCAALLAAIQRLVEN